MRLLPLAIDTAPLGPDSVDRTRAQDLTYFQTFAMLGAGETAKRYVLRVDI